MAIIMVSMQPGIQPRANITNIQQAGVTVNFLLSPKKTLLKYAEKLP